MTTAYRWCASPAVTLTQIIGGKHRPLSSTVPAPTATDWSRTSSTPTCPRSWAVETNHRQPGDPEKAAAVIVDMAHADKVPARLLLGSDSVTHIERALTAALEKIDDYRTISASTDY